MPRLTWEERKQKAKAEMCEHEQASFDKLDIKSQRRIIRLRTLGKRMMKDTLKRRRDRAVKTTQEITDLLMFYTVDEKLGILEICKSIALDEYKQRLAMQSIQQAIENGQVPIPREAPSAKSMGIS